MKRLVTFALLAASASPALCAGASNFTLVNGTGAVLADLSIRRAGTQAWKPLGTAPFFPVFGQFFPQATRVAIEFSPENC
jgi:hypothetical protein